MVEASTICSKRRRMAVAIRPLSTEKGETVQISIQVVQRQLGASSSLSNLCKGATRASSIQSKLGHKKGMYR